MVIISQKDFEWAKQRLEEVITPRGDLYNLSFYLDYKLDYKKGEKYVTIDSTDCSADTLLAIAIYMKWTQQ